MSYLPLGPRNVTAALDTTELNTGNVTALFTEQALGLKVPWVECYHVAFVNVPSNTMVKLYISQRLYTTAQLDTIGDWDPNQPALIVPGDTLALLFNFTPAAQEVAALGDIVVWAWFRYDPSLPNNSMTPAS